MKEINKENLPAQWLLILFSALWAILLYGVLLPAFGIAPSFPPAIATIICIGLGMLPYFFLPRWKNNSPWNKRHLFSIIFGTLTGSMLISFIGATPADLYFKIIVDVIAITLLIVFGLRMKSGNNLNSPMKAFGDDAYIMVFSYNNFWTE